MSKSISDWVAELLGDDKNLSKEATRALSYMGETAVEPLLDALHDENVDLKLLAKVLGQIGEPALDSLGMLLRDNEVHMREQAARVLALISDGRSVLSLVMSLDDPEPSVRAAVSQALGSFSDPRAVSALIDMLDDTSPDVRASAAEALGSYYRDSRVIPALIKAANDEVAHVRIGTAKAMARVHDERIKAKLETLTEDANSDVRLTAAAALQHQGGDKMVFQRMDRNVTQQVDAIAKKMMEDETIDEADIDLMRHSNPQVRARLLELVGESNSDAAVKMLLPGLKDINPAVRQTAVETLATLGISAVDPLLHAIHDESKYIRAGAVEALAIIADARGIQSICQSVEKDESELVRREAALALGKFGKQDNMIVKALKHALRDSDNSVRDAAQKSLDILGVDTSNPVSRFFKRLTGNN